MDFPLTTTDPSIENVSGRSRQPGHATKKSSAWSQQPLANPNRGDADRQRNHDGGNREAVCFLAASPFRWGIVGDEPRFEVRDKARGSRLAANAEELG